MLSIGICILGLAGMTLAQTLPSVQPPIDRERMENDYRQHLPSVAQNYFYWDAGWLPQGCSDMATDRGLNAADFTIFNVHYEDCGDPWTFCRHKDSQASEADMIDVFGRIPVRTRSYFRHIVSVPSLGDGVAAITWSSGDVAIAGIPRLDTMIHEASHSLDWNAVELKQYGFQFSSTSVWQDAYAQDSASSTDYALTNWLENFAEAGMVGMYDKVVPNGISNALSNWPAIYNQFNTFTSYLGDTILPGGTCANRFANTDSVPMGAFSAKMRVPDKPDVSFKSNVTIIEVDPENEGKVISCSQ